jgi:hypothetical protein
MKREMTPLFGRKMNSLWLSNSAKLLEAIADFPAKFASMRPESFTAKSMNAFFANYVEDELASNFTTSVIGFYKHVKQTKLSDEEALKFLSEFASSENDIDISYKHDLNDAIVRLLKSDNMSLVLKGSKLYYEINETPDVIEIVTEIRPVFSNDASQMKAFIIRNVLHVKTEKFLNIDEHEFSLSRDQLLELREKCDRAIKKIEAARKRMSEISENGVAIFGEQYEH